MEAVKKLNNDQSIIGWVLAGVGAIMATLSGALSWIYKKQIADYERNEADLREQAIKERTKLELKIENIESKLNHCETEHTQAKIELAKINERLRLLEKRGCLTGNCQVGLNTESEKKHD